MARARNIKPGFFKNEDLAELPFHTRLLFIGLWTLADREGRQEDRPKRIKMEVFPADNIDIDKALSELHQFGFIVRYQVAGQRYIAIPTFLEHQNPHHKEAASTIPKPEALPQLNKPKASDSGGNDGGNNLGQASDLKAMERGVNPADSLIPDSLIPDSLIPESGKERTATRARKPDFQMVGFGEFWSHYPMKGKRPAAEEAWSVLAPDPGLRITIMAALEEWKQCRRWSDRQYIPLPDKWLKNRQWEDDVPRETAPVAQQDRAAAEWLGRPGPAIEQ